MKTLMLCAVLAAFAIGAQAGDKKNAKATKDACCETTKAANAKACETDKAACCNSAKGATCKDAAMKKALLSPKHAGEVRS
jgi:hypothetical protein